MMDLLVIVPVFNIAISPNSIDNHLFHRFTQGDHVQNFEPGGDFECFPNFIAEDIGEHTAAVALFGRAQ